MAFLRDRRFRRMPSFEASRDREIRDFIVIAVLLCASIVLIVVIIDDLLRQAVPPLSLKPTVGAIGLQEARDAA